VLVERFLRSVVLPGERVPDSARYPWDLPAVRGVRDTPLDLDHDVVFLVGENGSGKSTLMEGLAVALGLNPEGGSQNMAFATRESHSPLHEVLRVARGARRPRSRYFLRAESFYNVATLVDEIPEALAAHGGVSLHARSHGESFLALVNHRFARDGLYLLDEPEAALSPTGLLALLRRMHDLVADGSQFVVATHAPMLMAYPGARIYALDDGGIAPVAFEDTEHFRLTRAFLEAPERFLRTLLADD
jgi:predicted ATPase